MFGHTQKPYHRVVNSGDSNDNHFRHAINIGSVPKDGNPKGCYVLLTINDNSSISVAENLTVEFIRFDHDVEKAAKAVKDSRLPDYYADALRKAR